MLRPVNTDLEIAVSLDVRLHVVLETKDEADAFAVYDEEGEALELVAVQGGETRWSAPLPDGTSTAWFVNADAAWLVLYRNDQPVREMPVAFDPFEETVELRL